MNYGNWRVVKQPALPSSVELERCVNLRGMLRAKCSKISCAQLLAGFVAGPNQLDQVMFQGRSEAKTDQNMARFTTDRSLKAGVREFSEWHPLIFVSAGVFTTRKGGGTIRRGSPCNGFSGRQKGTLKSKQLQSVTPPNWNSFGLHFLRA